MVIRLVASVIVVSMGNAFSADAPIDDRMGPVIPPACDPKPSRKTNLGIGLALYSPQVPSHPINPEVVIASLSPLHYACAKLECIMLLEFEIERIANSVQKRLIAPHTAATALTHLLSEYLRAGGRRLDLTLFQSFTKTLFDRHFGASSAEPIAPLVIRRAHVLLRYPREPRTATIFHLPHRRYQ